MHQWGLVSLKILLPLYNKDKEVFAKCQIVVKIL